MNKIIALLTDFGLSDHFAGSMKGVILSQNPDIKIFDLSHEIQPQNVLEAAYTLSDTLPYWPAHTLFVAVVDPGVGTDRRSLWIQTVSGHQVICPDNGLLTLVQKNYGLSNIREISDPHRLPGSDPFFTFYGRDIYAYNAGRIACGMIRPEELGPEITGPIVVLPVDDANFRNGEITGHVIKVERPFGNLCTNIHRDLLQKAHFEYGDIIHYVISEAGVKRLEGRLPLVRTFGEVAINQALIYLDSSGRLGFSINHGHFSDYFQMDAGLEWKVQMKQST
jgi:S-adenosylmethionine hydrolase